MTTRLPPAGDLDGLLAHADWLRRLAVCLVRDTPLAEDLVQDTWLVAVRSPPPRRESPRAWLAEVLRNLVRMHRRGTSRRQARERALGSESETVSVSSEALLERVGLERELVTLLDGLEEPFRTTLLLRFFEGWAPIAIARAQGVPPGTVRWRLSEGIRRLRERLDQTQGRERWRALLLPLLPAEPPVAARPPASSGVGVAPKAALVAGGTAALALALFAAREGPPGVRPRSAPSPALQPATMSVNATTTNATEETNTMTKHRVQQAAALFGVVLPALVASADNAQPLPREDAIAFCVEQREWVAEKCANEFADLLVERVPPEKRAGVRQKAYKEIMEGGTGPLEPRQKACAAELDKGKQLAKISTYSGRDAVRTCQKNPDCKAALACGQKVMFGK